MHPRNRYFNKRVPDFWELAEFRPSLKPFLIEKQRGTRLPQAEAPPTEDDPSVPTPSAADPTVVSDPANPSPSTPSVPIPVSTPIPVSVDDPSVPTAGVEGRKKFAYTLDFSSPEAVRELTYAVLEKDFGLQLEIPVDSLIPTVPQKLNYIHWVEDLLRCGDVPCEGLVPEGKNVVGIDIGTGMSCIYPLMGSKLNRWSFVATDISPATVQCAMENVSRNNLQDYIKVELVSEGSMLKEVVDSSSNSTHYAFSMCNPPFFKSKEEQQSGCARSRPLPATFSRGTEKETMTEGGEVGFVKRMIQDSLTLREKIRWYTTLLGKKSSLKELQSELTSCQVPVVTTTEFVQGKTWRWGLAWSFDETLKIEVVKMKKKRKQSHSCLQLRVVGGNGSAPSPSSAGVQRVKKWLEEEWAQLEVTRTVESCDASHESCDVGCESHDCTEVRMRCFAERAMWSHPRKVRRLKERLDFHSKSCVIQGMADDQRQATESSLAEIKLNLEAEINALCKICNMEFTTCIKLQEQFLSGQVSVKRRKTDTRRRWRKRKAEKAESEPVKGTSDGEEGRNGMADAHEMAEGEEGPVVVGEDKCVCVELDWVSGDQETDYLHQLLQYLQNRMSMPTVDFH